MGNITVHSIYLSESKPRNARALTDGEVILATVDLGMPPERVFRALTTDEVEKWSGSRIRVTMHVLAA